MSDQAHNVPGLLALEDGTVFPGRIFGATGTALGEVVFNTAMTGYQEIITDPSYCGQIVVMTATQIGNYGVNEQDIESPKPHARGFVVRELAKLHSNYRATSTLGAYLAEHNVVGISEVDTRALTRHLRQFGAVRGVVTSEISDPSEAVAAARKCPDMVGADLVCEVVPKEPYEWKKGFLEDGLRPQPVQTNGNGKPLQVVAIDCGIKRTILRHLVDIGCQVSVVPPSTPAEAVLERRPDGVFVSNGPGDPAAVGYAVDQLKGLVGRVPIFGICLGHQLLGLALGGKSFKLKFGHHGGNHPVLNKATGKVEITAQNHGFAIEPESIERNGCKVTHVNLYDQTLEGFAHTEWPLLAVQYHPEAGPGPHDASYLFGSFVDLMRSGSTAALIS